jgi:hypothetical protein
MPLEIGAEFAELVGMLGEWIFGDRKKKTPPRLETCLRCGAGMLGAQCPECRYVFRIKGSRRLR